MKMKRKIYKTKALSSSNSTDAEEQSPPDVSELVIWRNPLLTIYYAFMQIGVLLKDLWNYATSFITKKTIVLFVAILALIFFLHQTPGSHQQVFVFFRKKLLWSLYWIGLGFASSAGFGFGLHTFLLYLGPHIINVTLSAYRCESVDFLDPPYPERMLCPEEKGVMTPWIIMYKVLWECFLWGAGTAIGELPPYFMARTYRLANKVDEEEARLQALRETDSKDWAFKDRCKIFIQDLVNKIGFFGILLCASVPNPLFDLAGITCGHFLIPFRTFFGATLIGKAVIKMSIQTMFVIFIFSEHHFQALIDFMRNIPFVGPIVMPSIEKFFKEQRDKLTNPEIKESPMQWFLNMVVSFFLVLFFVSIVNELANKYKSNMEKAKSADSQK